MLRALALAEVAQIAEDGMELGPLLLNTYGWVTDTALLVCRFAIGMCFVIHGLGKLGLVGTGNMQGFADWLKDLGVPMPAVQARVAMLSEIIGGTLLAAGLFTRPACLLLIATMFVAGRVGHRDSGYLITNDPPGAEYTINLAVICGVMALLGPGRASLDFLIF